MAKDKKAGGKVMLEPLLRQKVERVESAELREILLFLLEEVQRLRDETGRSHEVRKLDEILTRVAGRQDRLEEAMAELAKGQRRLEERQDRLEEAMAELAKGQRRLEERQDRLEERLDKLTRAVQDLTEAVKNTLARMEDLDREHRETRSRLEALSDTVGYILENRAYVGLPSILKEKEGVEVEGRLIREYVILGGRLVQFNIIGTGRRNGERVYILGEAKVRPSKREIERFNRMALRFEKEKGVPVIKVLVAHDFPREIEEYARKKGILPVWSYEFEWPRWEPF
ncbi:hypothetical protein [Thermosulfurimonas sp. F29]|uniref:hypothetical protein n=1 Tax=Thermosulfurimonas sp. F29 TaxID=2867247 RepID=UPI001C839AD6|nr:hypothetical protein [Thermosulfurimonas sp. F29]MBX6423586.1 hypothetical protein [Thermosulfurimonas sp. F29]